MEPKEEETSASLRDKLKEADMLIKKQQNLINRQNDFIENLKKELQDLKGSMPVIDAIKGYADKNTLALQANLDKCTSENELWEKEVERLQDEIRNYWEKVSVHHDITGAPESVEQSLRREIERLKEELKKKQ